MLGWFKKKLIWHRIFPSVEAAQARIALNAAATLEVDGRKVCIAHSKEGFFAVNNRCPHNGFSLGQGFCTEDNAIVCPLHRYRFDLRTGRARSGLGDYVETYPLEVRPDGIYIGLKS